MGRKIPMLCHGARRAQVVGFGLLRISAIISYRCARAILRPISNRVGIKGTLWLFAGSALSFCASLGLLSAFLLVPQPKWPDGPLAMLDLASPTRTQEMLDYEYWGSVVGDSAACCAYLFLALLGAALLSLAANILNRRSVPREERAGLPRG